jgi:hypothetical protein
MLRNPDAKYQHYLGLLLATHCDSLQLSVTQMALTYVMLMSAQARKVPPPPRFDDVVPRMSDLLNNDKPADMTQAEPLGRRDNKQASKAAGPSNKRKVSGRCPC